MSTDQREPDTSTRIQPVSLGIQDLSYSFDGKTRVLENISLEIPPGSFCTLLGASGSGKTTLLRLIAGLIPAESGRIVIGDRDVTELPTQKRDIGFVFQNYALFPHYTVARNLEFPLRLRKVDKRRRKTLIDETLEIVSLSQFKDRHPAQLSGGQQQRVAVARALIYQPSVMLLDEPLGALDKRLRQQLGRNLREIQQRTGITAVYVTHDQEEAFALSDQIVLMEHGRIQQAGDPEMLYRRPRNQFVASFLGESNLWSGDVVEVSGTHAHLDIGGDVIKCGFESSVSRGENRTCSLRPEDVHLTSTGGIRDTDGPAIRAAVRSVTFLGSRMSVQLDAVDADLQILAEVPAMPERPHPGDIFDVSWNAGDAFITE